MRLPLRYQRTDAARLRFGDRVDRLAPFLEHSDPLADAAVEALAEPRGGLSVGASAWIERGLRQGAGAIADAPTPLRELIATVERVPFWVDRAACDRGGALLRRAGLLGGITLGAKALLYGYSTPDGNKPLVFSGRLRESAARRLNETARFVHAVIQPGGLVAGADGYCITAKVRLMHAQVRRMILRTGRWQPERWGLPVNQHDMAATLLLFSTVTLDGLRQLGLHIERDESEDYMHLWRTVGHLIGVDPELSPTSEREAVALCELISATQGAPDDDSRALAHALLEASEHDPDPERRRRAVRARPIAHAIVRHMLGDTLADQLAVPPSRLVRVVPTIARAVAAIELVRRRSPRIARRVLALGDRYWAAVVRGGLAGATHEFALPERLGGLPVSISSEELRP